MERPALVGRLDWFGSAKQAICTPTRSPGPKPEHASKSTRDVDKSAKRWPSAGGVAFRYEQIVVHATQ